MDVGVLVSLTSLILGAGIIVGASVVAAVVARRRGLDQVDAQADSEVRKAMDAQGVRLTLQDREIADLRSQVADLRAQVIRLTADLGQSDAQVRRLTAQVAGDGR